MAYKYCQKCGNANDANNKFCEACGANLSEQNRAAFGPQYKEDRYMEPVPAPKKSGGKAKIIVPVILALLLIGGGVFAYFQFFAGTDVDLVEGFDDKVLIVTGRSGEMAVVDIDEDRVKELQHYNDAEPEVKNLIDSLEYDWDRKGETDLENGDKVVITVTFDKAMADENRIRVKNADGDSVKTTVKIVGHDEKNEEQAQQNNSSNNSDNNSSQAGSSGRYANDRDDIYYAVEEELLDYDDVITCDKSTIQKWINYICAKNGYEFHKSGAEKDYFESLEWYNEIGNKTRSNDEVERRMYGTEKENYKTLIKARSKK